LIHPIVVAASIKAAVIVGVNALLTSGKKTENINAILLTFHIKSQPIERYID